jgi:hypothetical protein
VFTEHDFNSADLAKDGHGAETSRRGFLERISQNLGRRHLDPSVGIPKALVDFNRPWKPFARTFSPGGSTRMLKICSLPAGMSVIRPAVAS